MNTIGFAICTAGVCKSAQTPYDFRIYQNTNHMVVRHLSPLQYVSSFFVNSRPWKKASWDKLQEFALWYDMYIWRKFILTITITKAFESLNNADTIRYLFFPPVTSSHPIENSKWTLGTQGDLITMAGTTPRYITSPRPYASATQSSDQSQILAPENSPQESPVNLRKHQQKHPFWGSTWVFEKNSGIVVN